jgi:hypothetical protein
MSNMSYCRYSNTLEDLKDCYRNLLSNEISEDESKSRKELIELCKDIVLDAESGLLAE